MTIQPAAKGQSQLKIYSTNNADFGQAKASVLVTLNPTDPRPSIVLAEVLNNNTVYLGWWLFAMDNGVQKVFVFDQSQSSWPLLATWAAQDPAFVVTACGGDFVGLNVLLRNSSMASLDFSSLSAAGVLQPSYAPSGSILRASSANVTLVNDGDMLDIAGTYDDNPIIGVGLVPNTLTQVAFYSGHSQFTAPFPKTRNDVVAISNAALWTHSASIFGAYALLALQRPVFVASTGVTTLRLDQFAGDEGFGFGATQFTWLGSRTIGPVTVSLGPTVDDVLLWGNNTVFFVSHQKSATTVVRFDYTGSVKQVQTINEVVVCADH